jgi:hypothetical protein
VNVTIEALCSAAAIRARWENFQLAASTTTPNPNKTAPVAHRIGKQPGPVATLMAVEEASKPEENFVLPIQIWALGTHVVESITSDDPQPQYWLRVCGKYVSVLSAPIAKGTSVVEFELGHDINHIEVRSMFASPFKVPKIWVTTSSQPPTQTR